MRLLRFNLLALALLTTPLPVSPATILVPADQATIQDGIDMASYGDTVLVAWGTYFEHDIVMSSGVTLKGLLPEQGCVVVDAQQLGRVLICDGIDNVRIEDLTITGGLAVDAPGTGGGVSCSASSVRITKCTVSENSARLGGGVACVVGADVAIDSCTFMDNWADWAGGALISRDGSSLTATACHVTNNSAGGDGGGFVCYGGFLVIDRCVFTGNANPDLGGGLYVYDYDSSSRITNSTFMDNLAYTGGGIATQDCAGILITDCTFTTNDAIWGGGLACFYEGPSITGCRFEDNRGYYGGGGLYSSTSPAQIADCEFVRNLAAPEGFWPPGLGGGVLFSGYPAPTVFNCRFIENVAADYGGGLYCKNASPILVMSHSSWQREMVYGSHAGIKPSRKGQKGTIHHGQGTTESPAVQAV